MLLYFVLVDAKKWSLGLEGEVKTKDFVKVVVVSQKHWWMDVCSSL